MIRFAIAVAGIGLSMIAAAPLSADTAEQTYINRLDANNIHYGTRSQGLAMGHAVCRALDANDTPGTVVGALRHNNRLGYDDAAAIAAAAIVMFCPWDRS